MRLDAADFADAERRKSILKDMLGGMGEHVHIDIDFRCEYGKNGVTSAGSVVTRSVPADCVAVGNPCRVIKNSDGGASVGSGLSDLPSPVPTGPARGFFRSGRDRAEVRYMSNYSTQVSKNKTRKK